LKPQPTEFSEQDVEQANEQNIDVYLIYVKKTTVLNTLVTMTMTSDIENSKN